MGHPGCAFLPGCGGARCSWVFVNRTDAAETKSCSLWGDSRQASPLVNLSEGWRKRLLFLCCPPSSIGCSQGINISPLKQLPPGEAHLRTLCIWVKTLTKFIEVPVIRGKHGRGICSYFWNWAADARDSETSPQQGKGQESHPSPPYCPPKSAPSSVLGL